MLLQQVRDEQQQPIGGEQVKDPPDIDEAANAPVRVVREVLRALAAVGVGRQGESRYQPGGWEAWGL